MVWLWQYGNSNTDCKGKRLEKKTTSDRYLKDVPTWADPEEVDDDLGGRPLKIISGVVSLENLVRSSLEMQQVDPNCFSREVRTTLCEKCVDDSKPYV